MVRIEIIASHVIKYHVKSAYIYVFFIICCGDVDIVLIIEAKNTIKT